MARRLSSICSFGLLRLWIWATLTGFSTKNVFPHVFIQVHENQRFPRQLVQRHACAPKPPSPDPIDKLLEALVMQDNEQMRRVLADAVRTVLQAEAEKKVTVAEAEKKVAEATADKKVAEAAADRKVAEADKKVAEADKKVAEAEFQKKITQKDLKTSEDNLLAVKGELTARDMMERFANKEYGTSPTAQVMQSI
ncbi:uxuA, partial [Symbiodinium pilosum]